MEEVHNWGIPQDLGQLLQGDIWRSVLFRNEGFEMKKKAQKKNKLQKVFFLLGLWCTNSKLNRLPIFTDIPITTANK